MPTPAKPALSETTRVFGKRVLARRNELELSQERAAEACGLHWSYLGQVERGQRNITLHNIMKIASGLKVDAGRLVSGLPVPPGE